MTLHATQHGLTPPQIAQPLDLDPARLKAKVNLLDGIHPTAVELLKDRPITAGGPRLLRRVKPPRPVEMARLMPAGDNYACAYAQALLIGSRPEQIPGPAHARRQPRAAPEQWVYREVMRLRGPHSLAPLHSGAV